MENMIRKSSNNPHSASTRRKIDQLYSCVRYCEDDCRCRRTMQLEFFGEKFDKAKCNQTCDNCKAGREPIRREVTDEAKTILKLLESIQKNQTALVTLAQLTQLYNGSKAKAATKNLNTDYLTGYGAGRDLKKGEADRITHHMMFERVLEETSVENQRGFSSDYVNPGENARALLSGGKRLFVEFPQQRKKSNEENKKPSAKKKKKSTTPKKKKATTTKKVAKAPKSKPAAATASINDSAGGLSFVELDDSSSDDESDDDVLLFSLKGNNKNAAPPILPDKHTKALIDLIKQLTQSWANEEKLMGNKVFCKSIPWFGGRSLSFPFHPVFLLV